MREREVEKQVTLFPLLYELYLHFTIRSRSYLGLFLFPSFHAETVHCFGVDLSLSMVMII